MKYASLIDVSLRHPYYPDGRCSDFTIVPTPDTKALAANHRLILRYRPDGVSVAAPLDVDGGLFIPLPTGSTFSWRLTLRNPSFSLFTDLTAIHEQSSPRFLAERTTEPVTALTLTDGTGVRGTFAEVAIAYDDRPTNEGSFARGYHLDFVSSQSHWSYYCVTDLAATAGALSIDDLAVEPLAFGPERTRDLVARPDPTDPIAAALADRYPTLRRIRFVSDRPVASARDARRRVELRLDDERLLGPLPIPHLAAPTPLEIGPDGAVTPLAALSQIVTYAKQSTASNGGQNP